MPADPSFQVLVEQLQAGDQTAAAEVFRRFVGQLVGLAHTHLDPCTRAKAGPEDVVQSVFRSFFVRQRQGQFDLDSWDNVWAVLVVMTLRKCSRRVEHFQAARRDIRREAQVGPSDDSHAEWQLMAREPTPAEVVQLTETLEHLLGRFKDRERAIVELRLQSCPVEEIAERLGCSERKVYRVLQRARKELADMQAAEVGPS